MLVGRTRNGSDGRRKRRGRIKLRDEIIDTACRVATHGFCGFPAPLACPLIHKHCISSERRRPSPPSSKKSFQSVSSQPNYFLFFSSPPPVWIFVPDAALSVLTSFRFRLFSLTHAAELFAVSSSPTQPSEHRLHLAPTRFNLPLLDKNSRST